MYSFKNEFEIIVDELEWSDMLKWKKKNFQQVAGNRKLNDVTIFTCHLEKLSSDLEISLKLYLFKYSKIIIYIIFYKINVSMEITKKV